MKKDKSVRKAEMKAAVISKLKSLAAPVIITAIILVGVLVIINFQNAEEQPDVVGLNGYEGPDTPIVVENAELKLTLDPTTTQFSIEVKSSGKVWYSNPPEAAHDPLAVASEKGRIQSTLLMTYSQSTGLETTFDNFNYGIDNGLYEIETGDDYIRVDYSIGDVEREYVIPPVKKASEFDDLIAQMVNTDADFVKRYYKKYDINNLGKNDDKDELLANYPILETEPVYVLRDTAQGAVPLKLEQIFESYGYDIEELAADKELNFLEKGSDKPVFNVSIIYRLEGGDLVVEVPFSSLDSKKTYPIYKLVPLPYFGAGGPDDEGYLLVPEGGGALINFNNNKISQSRYYANMYGWDMALSRDAVVHDTRAYFNVFGIANGDDSFICIMEEGVPYASIQADIAGHGNSYNWVNAVYSIKPRELYEIGDLGSQSTYKFLDTLPDETLTQRYRFVDSSSYVDMAKTYQGYLKDKYGQYFAENGDDGTPVALEIVGAVDKVKQIVGIPVSRPLKLTGYDEAEDMIRQLVGEGMGNISVKYVGWCNGGVNQKILRKAKTVSALGSSKDLKALGSAAKELGVDLYLEGVTHYEYDSNILDGFFSFTDAARFLSKERAELHVYSAVTYSLREGTDPYYLLHADLIGTTTKALASAAEKYNANVAFRDAGMDLSSDYYLKNTVSRNAAMLSQAELLKQISDSGQKIMINMGNDYALPYADIVTNMDLAGSGYTILDKEIPFYQIAVHGYVNYTGRPLNICGNIETELLVSAEYGAGLSFSLMRETAFALQKTLYTQYYASDFEAWHDRMMDIYNRYDRELGHVFNQEMVGHEKLSEELSCTVYEDGTKVYVNYSFTDAVTPDGVEVPARDYKVVR
ncbi:MAG: hypothetical protein J1E01_04110 [Acetatifactor sp.]|nr:hypothetical protein [Acetatifactor sp.]